MESIYGRLPKSLHVHKNKNPILVREFKGIIFLVWNRCL